MSEKEEKKERRFSREFKLAALARMAAEENVIPTSINYNSYAHFLCPMDMIVPGWFMSLFHASQQRATISS